MKNTFAAFLFCFFSMVPFSFGEKMPLLFVGKIEIPPQERPADCYEVVRDGKSVALEPGMNVLNGDEVIPKKGKKVRLVYKHTACESETITEKTVVNCDPSKLDTPGWFSELFSYVLDVMKLNLKPADTMTETTAAVTKKDEKEINLACFPEKKIRLSPWPVDGTTALYGEPLHFRWDTILFEEETLACTAAKLVITPEKKPSNKPFVLDMKIGELLRVDAELESGASYRWHIEAGGKKISNDFHFRVLTPHKTSNALSQLRIVGEKYKDSEPILHQALYMLLTSDVSLSLDLYANALAFLGKNMNLELLPDDVSKLFQRHCWQ